MFPNFSIVGNNVLQWWHLSLKTNNKNDVSYLCLIIVLNSSKLSRVISKELSRKWFWVKLIKTIKIKIDVLIFNYFIYLSYKNLEFMLVILARDLSTFILFIL